MGREMNKVKGDAGERFAADILAAGGYRILERGFRCRRGEIDIIAEQDRILHFIEVKTRLGQGYGRPAEAVTAQKQSRFRQTAEYYLLTHGDRGQTLSMDVIEIELRHLEDCF